jgi:transposase
VEFSQNNAWARFDTPIILIEDSAPPTTAVGEVKPISKPITLSAYRLKPLPAFSPEYNPIEKALAKTPRKEGGLI